MGKYSLEFLITPKKENEIVLKSEIVIRESI